MLGAFANAFRTPDLRRKLLFVLFIIAIFRLGSQVPAPGVNVANVQTCLDDVGNSGIYSLINLFSGGALLQLTIFALGIMPYITASIILQLLVVVIPRLEALKKEGQSGQTKITQYTRYLTLGLAVLQATGIVALARSGNLLQGCDEPLLHSDGTVTFLVMVVTMTAGTAVIMWLGELITERGVGNGMSHPDLHAGRRHLPGRPVGGEEHQGLVGLRHRVSSSVSRSSRPSSSSSRRSAASRCSTPAAWWAARCSAAARPTSRSRSTRPASSRSSSPRRCSTCPRWRCSSTRQRRGLGGLDQRVLRARRPPALHDRLLPADRLLHLLLRLDHLQP